MKYLKTLVIGAFTLNLTCVGIVAGNQIKNNVTSQTAITARQSALLNIAKHVLSDTCWNYSTNQKIKIGDPIILKGSATGIIPTSCVYNPKTKQFVEVGYLDSELQAIRIFSIKEVQSAKSQLVKGD